MGTEWSAAWLRAFNTEVIVISGVFLLFGLYFIRRKQVAPHRACMLTATVFAAAFLVVYVARWLLFAPAHFSGEGPIRAFYYMILISHMILAVVQGPLIIVTL